MFEGDSADMCARQFPLMLMWGRANSQACTDGEPGKQIHSTQPKDVLSCFGLFVKFKQYPQIRVVAISSDQGCGNILILGLWQYPQIRVGAISSDQVLDISSDYGCGNSLILGLWQYPQFRVGAISSDQVLDISSDQGYGYILRLWLWQYPHNRILAISSDQGCGHILRLLF